MKFTLRTPVYLKKWYGMDGKENLSTNCGYREFSAEDRKKAGQVNNMLMLGLAAVACAVSYTHLTLPTNSRV